MKEYQNIKISIKDNGSGMSQKDLQRAFEPFFTTKGAVGGTGLGLSMAKRICDMLDAKISISSTVGEGTDVMVTFENQKGK